MSVQTLKISKVMMDCGKICNKEEIWKDIEGYIGKYQVSNLGNVRSLNFNNTGKMKNLKPNINRRTGHCQVELSKNNKKKAFMIARLVAEHFLTKPNEGMDLVTHISNDKCDNSVDNLMWCNTSQSRYLMYKKGNRKKGIASRYTITYQGRKYVSINDIARYYNVDIDNFRKRIYKGWSIDEALNIPVRKENCGGKPKYYELDGKYYSIHDLSKISGIKPRTIKKRIELGWGIEECINVPVGIMKKGVERSEK